MATPCSEELAQQTRVMVANIVAKIGKGPTLGVPSGGHQERKGKEPGPTEAKTEKPADPEVGQGNKRKQEQIKALKPLDGGSRRQIWRTQQRKQWQIQDQRCRASPSRGPTRRGCEPQNLLSQEEKQEPGEG